MGGTAAVASAIAETTFDVAVGARPGEAAVGSCAAICAGLDGASASATSALASAALRSLIAAALRVLEALSRFSASRLRMMASREPPLRPPNTTPTRWRLPLRIEVTRLKHEARV